MRVLYFSDSASDHNRCFLEKLREAELDVWFLDPTSDRLPENWLPDGVHWIRTRQKLPRNLAPSAFAGFLTEFQDWLKATNPDLIHAGPTHTCGYVTALSNFHPWLLATWGWDVLYQAEKGADWKQATRFAFSNADGFLFDCDAVRAKAREFVDLPDARIVQFAWGIKKGSFTPIGARPLEEQFRREPGTWVFICTRSWEPLYDIHVLLEAFRQAHRVDSSLRLLLVGNGSEKDQVLKFIAAHGLGCAINIPGRVSREDIPKWFRAADAYVSCAKTDSTSISLLEAMATGLPVVVSDIPSNREWVTEGKNGWLAPVGLAEAFAERLLCAARIGTEQRNLFSQQNRRIVEERADWDRNFPRLVEMYKQLVAVPVAR